VKKSVLDSRQLLAARVLADTGSFTLAGQQLSLTQSAVSHAIKALEEEVECRLFIRSGKGVVASAAGKHFLEYTDQILAQMETARTLVTPRATRGRERIRLGVSNRARQIILPVVQPLFQREYPNRLVLIEPGEYRRNFSLLDSGLLDLSFTVRAPHRPDLEFVPLFDDELRLIVSASHPWARAGRATCEDLAGNTLMLYQDFNNTAELLMRHLQAEQVAPRNAVQLPDHESIKMLVRAGRAVGVFSPWLVSKELQEGLLVSLQLGSRPLRRQWGLTYLSRRHPGPMEHRLIELCHQAVPGILSRLQGQAVAPREKKDSTIAPVAPTAAELTCVGVAL
jgi:DNA-binding transcriptional LysR family regulator